MRPSSMPASFASRRASGDEKMRRLAVGLLLADAPQARPFGAAGAGCAAGCCRLRGGLRGLLLRLRPQWRGLQEDGAFAASARRLHVLAFARQHRDDVVDRHVLRAFRHQDLRKRAVVDRLDLHGRLVGLDLGDHVAGLDRVAFLLQPLRKVALFHGGRQRGHQDVDRHTCNLRLRSETRACARLRTSIRRHPRSRPHSSRVRTEDIPPAHRAP